MIQLLREFAHRDSTFLNRFAARRHGRKRRYVAQDKSDLYRDRPDLCEQESQELVPGWWIGTNYSKQNIEKIIRLACEVARCSYGNQVKVELG